MNIYLAGRYGRREEIVGYIADLGGAGHTCSSRWLFQETDSTKRAVTDEQRQEWAVMEMEDIAKSDAMILFTEEPDVNGAGRGGRHFESGAAVAMNKPLVLVGPRENLFHWLPNIPQCETIEEALQAL